MDRPTFEIWSNLVQSGDVVKKRQSRDFSKGLDMPSKPPVAPSILVKRLREVVSVGSGVDRPTSEFQSKTLENSLSPHFRDKQDAGSKNDKVPAGDVC